ncbi:MAG: saccharopine dehydrogenase family protein [Actinomycetota bacterium]
MRVAVLGATSATGRRIARDLLERSEVSEVVLLDRSPEALRHLSGQLDEGRAGTAILGLSVSPLAKALAGCDVGIGTLPRDLKLERVVLRAAIQAELPYLTACQDAEMVRVLFSHDAEARDAQTPIVLGAGWTSGITNLLVMRAARLMDRILRVRVAWVVPSPGSQGSDWLLCGLQALSGDASVYEEGRWQRRHAGSQRQKVFFPEPVGWKEVGLVSGAEAMTLPRRLDGVEKVVVKGGVWERGVRRLLPRLPRDGRRADPLRAKGVTERSRRPASRAIRLVSWASARVDVSGLAGGTPYRLTYGVVDEIGKLVSAPLIAGALMLARADGKVSGVGPPEAFIDPDPFFALLGDQGIRVARLER